jgi:hypothetical protein
VSIPKIGSQHQLSVSERLTTAFASGGSGPSLSKLALLLDVDSRSGAPTGTGAVLRAAVTKCGAPAILGLHEAADLLAGGRGRSAEAALLQVQVENRRLQNLIALCVAQADATLSRLPTRVPIKPLDRLINMARDLPSPRPAAIGHLLRTASRIAAVRAHRDAGIGDALAKIFDRARSQQLVLFGDLKPAVTAETSALPVEFLLRPITLDTTLMHVGLALTRDATTLQRAIIAPDGARSAAYFNVRLLRDQFAATFRGELRNRTVSKTIPNVEVELLRWFVDVHLREHATTTPPTIDQSWDAIRAAHTGIFVSRETVRKFRTKHAPAAWNKPGPRSQKRGK